MGPAALALVPWVPGTQLPTRSRGCSGQQPPSLFQNQSCLPMELDGTKADLRGVRRHFRPYISLTNSHFRGWFPSFAAGTIWEKQSNVSWLLTGLPPSLGLTAPQLNLTRVRKKRKPWELHGQRHHPLSSSSKNQVGRL